ncbi:MAG: hypothetical protein NVS9B12_03920 [Vulcanimicrobiaceae bacterium]
MFHDLDDTLPAFAFHHVAAYRKDLSAKNGVRFHSTHTGFIPAAAGKAFGSTQERRMRRSTPLEELIFLAIFIALFAVTLAVLNRLLLPHHYNKVVVVVLASILVGAATVFARYWLFFRKRGVS